MLEARVYCIERELVAREMLRELVSSLGVAVRCATTVEEVLPEIEASPSHCALVILAWEGALANDREGLAALRRLLSAEGIALTSARSEGAVFHDLAPLEAGAFLPKPYTIERVRAFLKLHLPAEAVRPRRVCVSSSDPVRRERLADLLAEESDLHTFSSTSDAIRAACRSLSSIVVFDLVGQEEPEPVSILDGQEIPHILLRDRPGPATGDRPTPTPETGRCSRVADWPEDRERLAELLRELTDSLSDSPSTAT